jgi:protease I
VSTELKGLKVAILVANGFEQDEMTKPREALERAGAQVTLVSPEEGKVKGWKHTEWGDEFPVEVSLDDARADEYDALLLPGGVMNPDKLRLIPAAIGFVKEFVHAVKPIAAICHAPWILINAGGVDGKDITSWGSVKIDLINAGAKWVDEEVVRDGQLVTSRKPDDIPAFNKAMIALFAESKGRAKGTMNVR